MSAQNMSIKVSVPSRGNGVIDVPEGDAEFIQRLKGFRPLSGKWGYR